MKNKKQRNTKPKRDLSWLENYQIIDPKRASARCPVCAFRGNDYAGDRLRIWLPKGSYVCLNYRKHWDERLHTQAIYWHFTQCNPRRVVWTEENIPFKKLSKRRPAAKNAKLSKPSKTVRVVWSEENIPFEQLRKCPPLPAPKPSKAAHRLAAKNQRKKKRR